MTKRNVRLCDVCGGLDTDPRHVQGVPPGYPGAVPTNEFLDSLPENTPPRAVAELLDPGTVVRHHDCCANTGCLLCQATEAANGGARGGALLKLIEGGSIDHLSGSQRVEEM